jgi:leucyl aminopeptidase
MGNGAADADGAQARGAGGVSVNQGVKVARRSDSMTQWTQEALLERGQSLVRQKIWEQFWEASLDHELLLEKLKKGKTESSREKEKRKTEQIINKCTKGLQKRSGQRKWRIVEVADKFSNDTRRHVSPSDLVYKKQKLAKVRKSSVLSP